MGKAYDNEGKIDSKMFEHALKTWGDKMTKAEIDDIFGEFEIDEDYMIKTKDVEPVVVEEAWRRKRTLMLRRRRRRRRRPPSKLFYKNFTLRPGGAFWVLCPNSTFQTILGRPVDLLT